MTILVTAFAGAGAGIAYSSTAGRSLAAGGSAAHAAVHVVSVHLPGCNDDMCHSPGPATPDVGAWTGYTGGPLASYANVGSPATAFVTKGEDQDDAWPVLGKDQPEEATNPSNMPASEEMPASVNVNNIPSGEGGSSGGPVPGHHHHHHHGPGPGHHHHHHGPGPGHHHHHHGPGPGRHHHHHHGPGKGHHGTGPGGNGASTGATTTGTSTASQGSLPTTGAPLAGLIGLAVVALGAGVFLRMRRRGDEEEQSQES